MPQTQNPNLWYPISTAPKDGTLIWVYAPAYEDLLSIQCFCRWHEEGGWCVDELRHPTHWTWVENVYLPDPKDENQELLSEKALDPDRQREDRDERRRLWREDEGEPSTGLVSEAGAAGVR